MKTALFVIALLAACPGFGLTAFSQEPGKNKGEDDANANARPTLTWEQLARQSGLLGLLEARSQDRFAVDVLFARPAQVLFVRAEVELTAAEWAHFTRGGSKMDFLSSWSYGELFPPGTDLRQTQPAFFPDSQVDVSRIPPHNHHITLVNEAGEESRLYVLAPNKDGKTGALFYFYATLRPGD